MAPHNPSGPVATAATVQAGAAMRNFRILEFQWHEAADWRSEPIDHLRHSFVPESTRDVAAQDKRWSVEEDFWSGFRKRRLHSHAASPENAND